MVPRHEVTTGSPMSYHHSFAHLGSDRMVTNLIVVYFVMRSMCVKSFLVMLEMLRGQV